jgi:hypothetical protein
VVLAVVGASLLVRTTSFVTESILRSEVMESAKIGQERVFDQLFSAKVLSLQGASGSSPVLTVVVPVEQPVNGGPEIDFLDSNGNVNWGVMEPNGPMLDRPGDPHRLTLSVLPADTLSEKTVGVDVNQDRDLLDSFQIGTLVVRTSGGEETTLVTGRLILGETGNGAFDIDGDGSADPLFHVTGEPYTDVNKNGVHDSGEGYIDSNGNNRWDGALSVNILTFVRDRDGRGHRFIYKTVIKLLNN